MISNKGDNYKWVVLAVSFMLMLTFAISLQSLPPIFEKISQDISFSNSEAGILMGAYAIPGIFLPFFIAFLASKYNKKSIIMAALLILIGGLITFSRSGSFSTLLVTRLIAGTGATVLVVLAPLLITMFFGPKNIGVAMGVFNAAVPFGTVVAANLFGLLGETMHWRSIILSIAGFVALVFVVVILALSFPKKEAIPEEEMSSRESSKGLFTNVSLWLLAIIWMLGNAQLLSYVTFAPQYFQTTGMTPQRASLFTSFIMFVSIFLSPVVGIIIDKTGWKKRLLLIGSIIMGLSFALISMGSFGLPLWAITLGVGFSTVPVFVFAMLPDVIKPHQMGMGLGVVTIASNIGIAFGPIIFGYILDKTGENFSLGFLILGLLSLIILLSLAGLRRKSVSRV